MIKLLFLGLFLSEFFSYNPSGAISYARKYWNTINHACSKGYLSCSPYSYWGSEHCGYPSHGGDCANFVSQCLLAGGHSHLSGGFPCRGYPCGKEEVSANNLGNCLHSKHGWSSQCGYKMGPPKGVKPGDVLIYHKGSCTSYEAHATMVVHRSGGSVGITCHSPQHFNATYKTFEDSHPYLQWLQKFAIEGLPTYNIRKDKHAHTYLNSKIFKNHQKKTLSKISKTNVPPKKERSRSKKKTPKFQAPFTFIPKKRKKRPLSSFLKNVMDEKLTSWSIGESAKQNEFSNDHKVTSTAPIIDRVLTKTKDDILSDMFLETQKKIELLWNKIPFVKEAEKTCFRSNFFNKFDLRYLSVLNSEVHFLIHYKNINDELQQMIDKREKLISTLRSFSTCYKSSIVHKHNEKSKIKNSIKPKKNIIEEVTNLKPNEQPENIHSKELNFHIEAQRVLKEIRIESLRIIEKIIIWRSLMSDPHARYIWKKMNYIKKIQSDLSWFVQSKLGKKVMKMEKKENALFMTPRETRESKKRILEAEMLIIRENERKKEKNIKRRKYNTSLKCMWNDIFVAENKAAQVIQEACKKWLTRRRKKHESKNEEGSNNINNIEKLKFPKCKHKSKRKVISKRKKRSKSKTPYPNKKIKSKRKSKRKGKTKGIVEIKVGVMKYKELILVPKIVKKKKPIKKVIVLDSSREFVSRSSYRKGVKLKSVSKKRIKIKRREKKDPNYNKNDNNENENSSHTPRLPILRRNSKLEIISNPNISLKIKKKSKINIEEGSSEQKDLKLKRIEKKRNNFKKIKRGNEVSISMKKKNVPKIPKVKRNQKKVEENKKNDFKKKVTLTSIYKESKSNKKLSIKKSKNKKKNYIKTMKDDIETLKVKEENIKLQISKEELEKRKKAAIKIQTIVRVFLARRRVKKLRELFQREIEKHVKDEKKLILKETVQLFENFFCQTSISIF